MLVIGGAGYIGCVLADALLTRGYRVRVLDNFLYDHFHVAEGLIARPRTSLLVGDLRDPHALDEALDGITDVVLLASLVGDPISRKYPDLARSVNLGGSTALLDALAGRGLRRFMFTSTCSNYGLWEGEEPATESAPLTPLSIYAETKVAFEQAVLERRGSIDFHPVILRLSTVFGLSPRMRFDLTVNEFARAIAFGAKLDVYDKDTWRPYCHVSDVCQAIVSALRAPGRDGFRRNLQRRLGRQQPDQGTDRRRGAASRRGRGPLCRRWRRPQGLPRVVREDQGYVSASAAASGSRRSCRR